jgi:Domain of unknown function (DUF6484)
MAKIAHGKVPPSRRNVVLATPSSTIGDAIPQQIPTACLGTIIAINPDGTPQVSVADGAPVVAMVLGQVPAEQLTSGSQVLVTFIDGDHQRPVILGRVAANAVPRRSATATAKVDGQRVELTGQDEVVLTCGKASITLTRAGKVMIKGTYVVTGSTGVNRLTGGSVQIN